jgi:iron complex transport system substrate-binding protein
MRMKMRRFAFHLLIGVAVLSVLSCGKPINRAEKADARPSNETTYPRRIVSMAPSITEVVFELGLGDRVVGVSDFCDYPPEARNKPKIGGVVNPNMEAVVALDPDLVMALPNVTHESMFRTLRQLGIKVLTLPNDTIEDLFNTIRAISEETSTQQAGAKLTDRLHAKFSEVSERVKDRPRRKVMFVVGVDPLFVAGGGTFIDELITVGGGTNIAGESLSKYPRLGVEQVVAREPEVILYTSLNFELTPEQEVKAKALWSAYPSIPAVREGRIYGLVADYVTLAGPRLAVGIEEMARAIHPEAFKEKEKAQ